MSHWTHIIGTIRVSPMGRTQPEKRYILDTVLAHLPLVTGSERDMEVHVNLGGGSSSSSSCDEFQMCTDKGKDWYGDRKDRHGWFDMEEDYLLTLVGNLRDREIEETFKEFQKWLTRLAKRIIIDEICVKIYAYEREIIISDANPYSDMFEWPSWTKDSEGEPNWCEYLMWDRWGDTPLPLELIYKYYNDDEADEEFERRRKLK